MQNFLALIRPFRYNNLWFPVQICTANPRTLEQNVFTGGKDEEMGFGTLYAFNRR